MNNVRNAAKPIPAKIPKDNQFDCTMLAMPHATIKNRNRVKAYPETVCASFASRQIIARINSTGSANIFKTSFIGVSSFLSTIIVHDRLFVSNDVKKKAVVKKTFNPYCPVCIENVLVLSDESFYQKAYTQLAEH